MLLTGPAIQGAARLRVPPTRTPVAAEAFDSRALLLLQQMADAYAHLPALNQRTEYTSEYSGGPPPVDDGIPDAPGLPEDGSPRPGPDSHAPETRENRPAVNKPTRMQHAQRLQMVAPNRLRLEIEEPDATDTVLTSQWISDGSAFWTYQPDKRWYTQERAPRSLKQFRSLAHLNSGSLEMLMLMGVNPFGSLREQAQGVRLGEPAIVNDVLTDTVILLTRDEAVRTTTEVRLSIGQADRLLRRLRIVTTQMPAETAAPIPGKVGDPLDELVDGVPPPTPLIIPSATGGVAAEPPATSYPPIKTVITCDNILLPASDLHLTDFVFRIPPGTQKYAPNTLNLDGSNGTATPQSLQDQIRQMYRQARPGRKIKVKKTKLPF